MTNEHYNSMLHLHEQAWTDIYLAPQHEKDVTQGQFWSGRPGFNPRSRHTKDFKNGTWYLLA